MGNLHFPTCVSSFSTVNTPLALILGIHPLDAAVVVLCLLAVLVIGVVVSRSVKGEHDFFVSGKQMGPWLTFFLNFGQATDSNGAPQVATEVYRQGVGGMWIAFQTLFITPFIWFTSVWFRRTRLISGPEMFVSRFNSRSLASFYAWFAVLTIPFSLGLGNIVSYKVAAAMMVKPPAEYTVDEQRQVAEYAEYEALKKDRAIRNLSTSESHRFEELESKAKRNLIASEISYLKPLSFYLLYTGIVAVYIILGGIKAAAVTDAFQGILIIAFSIMMIPIGLHHVGGFAGLHDRVPEHMFLLFGSPAMSEYTWYSIAAIVFASLVTFGQPGGPSSAAARDERTLRIGMLSGVFLKRFVMIAWMFCGLLAIAVVPSGLSDPDKVWGKLANELLVPGFMGLMIAGMLLGHMPAVGVTAVNFSATVTRNLYEPLVPNRSAKHYLFVAQVVIFAVLAASVVSALYFTGVIDLLSNLIMFNAYFGAVGFLMYFWRKLTAQAVAIGAVIWLLMMVVIAYGLPATSLARNPGLHTQTQAKVVTVRAPATKADVDAGKASKIGQAMTVPYEVPPKPVFFKAVVRSDPANPNSPLEGIERFHVENFIVASLGIPLEKTGPAGIIASRWLFAGISPFVILISLSYLTRLFKKPDPALDAAVDRFYARMKTPVNPNLEEDNREVALSEANPARFDHLKLFPKSSWEFCKWEKQDYFGFFGCWAGVLAILLMLWGLLQIGA